MSRIIVIGGPTASGKTALAIRTAQLLQTEIISADSRQCYTEMTIGTAKPALHELEAVRHHFINSHSLPFKVNAGEFAVYATPVLKNLLREKKAAVIAGGTGLYIQALLSGLDQFPDIPDAIRNQLRREAETVNSLQQHRDELQKKDPVLFKTIDRNNHRRIIRALEVIRTSGLPYSGFLDKQHKTWEADIRYYYPDPPRHALYERINQRVDSMLDAGLEEEARSLLKWWPHPALQTVGYREFFSYFRGEESLARTIELIKQHSRNYAKRQWTWFRNQGEWKALDVNSVEFLTGRLED